MVGSETMKVVCGQTVKPLKGMLNRKDSTLRNLMRYTKKCRLDLVGFRELPYKGVEAMKDGNRETN